ncbi:MAG: hypothetical protein GWN58_32955 [Anaerolineae bacterium]|nr:hypothetical protein [Thermoplasmata archaeon]NIV34085.1 hypothetical protein [Anaerolineae bacterium]NIY05936.1 hypothetical protein [Thermoplasmata archaeon]
MSKDTLMEKIEGRSGRIQMIVAELSRVAYAIEQDDDPDLEPLLWKLATLAEEYGHRWLDDTADLLKTLYNRRSP